MVREKKRKREEEATPEATPKRGTRRIINTTIHQRIDKHERNTATYRWTTEELNTFLWVLRRRGMSVGTNPEELKEFFPERTIPELKALIDSYRLKGKALQTQRENQRSGQEGENNDGRNEDGPSDSLPDEPVEEEEPNAALETWFQMIDRQVLRPDEKKDDPSEGLVAAMRNCAKEEVERVNEDGFSLTNIYEYIGDCLAGTFPRELNEKEVIVINQLLEHLSTATEKAFEDDKVRDFLEKGSWWEKKTDLWTPSTIDGSKSRDDNNIPSSSKGSNSEKGNKHSEGPSSSNPPPITCRETLDRYIQSCMRLPKIRKVSSCLNPLGVPVELLKLEHRDVQMTK